MTKRLLRIAFVLSCLAAFALGGAALAGAIQNRGGPAVSGDDAARAADAALRVAGGGQILSVERSDDGGAAWDVDVLRDGQEIEIRLDDSSRDISTRRDAEPAEADDQPLSPQDARRAGEAAVSAAGGGSVESVERSDDPGETYEIEVIRSGREIDVALDENFSTVHVRDDD